MKRLFVGLTLLLMAFLSTLDHVAPLHRIGAHVGVQRWMTELVLAVLATALFARACQLHRRLLFPRRGLRLLLVGIVLYVLGVAVSSGMLAHALAAFPLDSDSPWSDLPRLAALLAPWPLLVAAEVLLVVGSFRALTNLVPPDEFAEDF